MQVSAMPVVYPMIEAAPQPGVAVGSEARSEEPTREQPVPTHPLSIRARPR